MLIKKLRSIRAKVIIVSLLVACEVLFVVYVFDIELRRRGILCQSLDSTYLLFMLNYNNTKYESESNKRCEIYFNTSHTLDYNWSINNLENRKYSLLSKQQVENSVRNIRIYGKCFIEQNSKLNDENLQGKLFPYFTFLLPEYKRWDGTIVQNLPILNRDSLVENEQSSTLFKDGNHFWKGFKEKINGRGIVISLGESGVQETMQLLKVLRYLRNELPIQLVHKGDVSNESITKIIAVARDTVSITGQPDIIDFPQEVWFVNASNSIRDSSKILFQRFSNKWIACLFNSFDDIILMDSDVIPFISPSSFFITEEFNRTGALFFKDRANGETLKSREISFYRKLLPTILENKYFGIPLTSSLTDDNSFFKYNSKHVMESGLVVMRRSTHFTGLLISTSMQLWKATNNPIYGDKELFWLGQSISGNEMYNFNENSAAAIGIINEEKNTKRICSTQPAHFDKDLNLLWLNGGLKNCKKKASWQKDFKTHKYLRKTFKSMKNLKDNYDLSIKVDGAIIPSEFKGSFWNRIKNSKNGFQKYESFGCSGYVWCAFFNEELCNKNKGQLIRFNEAEVDHINSITAIWNS